MRKVSLIPYRLPGDIAYDVRGSLVELLFAVRLGPEDLGEHDRIARQIETAENNEVILDNKDYERLVFCLRANPGGYSRNDLEFVNRVMSAEEITVKEA